MTSKTTKRPEGRPRTPRKREEQRRPLWVWAAGVGALLVGASLGLVAHGLRGGSIVPATGLPRTTDYHSLLVAPNDPNTLVLGTHQGLFRSTDGGRTWAEAELAGKDAMNLAQPAGTVVWAAGHNVLAKSVDGGATWVDVRPQGLPSLDVHGFAVDPRDPERLYAAVAGQGLYRSTDGGRSFLLRSRVVGPGVMALAVLPDGPLLAGDMQRQILASSTDAGVTWKRVLRGRVVGLSVNPARARLVLATGPGVLRSADGGRTWTQTLELASGGGPVAWAPSDPKIAYVVGLDRSLWRSSDAGASWSAVVTGKEG